MKNFAKFLAVAIVMVVAVALLAVSASAAVSPNGDPKNLKPGSDTVIFISGPDEEGNYPGNGTGTDAQNPWRPIDHDKFDPNADIPQYDLQTAFYQATEELKDTGGTIVICGPLHLTGENSYGGGTSQRDVRTARFGDKVIKFTSVYNGVDYRETNGACLTVTAPAQISISGSSIWENIRIGAGGTERVIAFEYNTTLIGEGVECFPLDSAFEGVATNYISLAAGHRYAKGNDVAPTMTVMSGTYNRIIAGAWGVGDSAAMDPATTFLTLEGTTTVLGNIIGTVNKGMLFNGHVNITINDGTYECDISGVGPSGMTNTDGTVKLNINGGNFESTWSISATSMGMINNGPAAAIVDFSGWKGETDQLAYAYAAATLDETFTKVMLPNGVTEETLSEYLTPAETEPPVAETEDPVVEDETDAPEINEDENDKPDNDDTAVDVGDDEKDGGVSVGLIIGIAAGVVVLVAAAVVVGIVLGKKKASK